MLVMLVSLPRVRWSVCKARRGSINSVEAKWDHGRSILSAPTRGIARFRHSVDLWAWCQVRLVGEDIS